MKFVAWLVLPVLAGVVLAMGWQHFRYLKARRGPVQDRQPLFYGSSTLHVVTYLRVHPGEAPLEPLRKLRGDLEAGGAARVVYAGLSPGVALGSSQIAESSFDAVILAQYPSRGAYEETSRTSTYRAALSRFESHYTHGMDRPVLQNLGLPMLLLAIRAQQLLSGAPSLWPLTPVDEADLDEAALERREGMARLDGLRPYSEEAVVIFNLLKGGTRAQREADRRYGLQMARGFAEGGHGPMHMGRAVTLEGDADFDRVAIVYYPGISYFQELMTSRFFDSIVGGKQPGDTLAVPTVPVLDRL